MPSYVPAKGWGYTEVGHIWLCQQQWWAVGLALTLTPSLSGYVGIYEGTPPPLPHSGTPTGTGVGYDGYFPTGPGAKEAELNK
jgi:hypothetical protein